MNGTPEYNRALFYYLLTLTPRKRSNVKGLYFRPGEFMVELCCEAYPSAKSIDAKWHMVEWVTQYAATNDKAFELGVLASKEKSAEVNYWVCRLFACAQRKEALPILNEKVLSKNGRIKDDANFALKALASGNFRDYKPTSVWYPSSDSDRMIQRSDEEWNESVSYYIEKQLTPTELDQLKEIVGDLYDRTKFKGWR